MAETFDGAAFEAAAPAVEEAVLLGLVVGANLDDAAAPFALAPTSLVGGRVEGVDALWRGRDDLLLMRIIPQFLAGGVWIMNRAMAQVDHASRKYSRS